jgi:simple sugar transport system permease protein
VTVEVTSATGAIRPPAAPSPSPDGPPNGSPSRAATGYARTALAAGAAVTLPLAGAVAVFLVLVAVATDADPASTFQEFLSSSLGDADAVGETLTRAVPLGLIGVGTCVALRAGIFNVGGEAQMAMGAVAGYLVVEVAGGAPAPLVWLAATVVAGVGGAVWAAVSAVLLVRRGVSEILTTLLVNLATVGILTWLLQDTFLQDPDPTVITAQGARLDSRLELPLLVEGTRLHAGVLVVLAAVAATWWWSRTPSGLRVDLVGANPRLAAHGGVRPRQLRTGAFLASAAVAGVAGAVQLFGVSHRLTTGLTAGVGYSGVLVAVLGRARPLPTALFALVFAVTVTGSEAIELDGVPRALGYVLQGVLVVGVAGIQGALAWRGRR